MPGEAKGHCFPSSPRRNYLFLLVSVLRSDRSAILGRINGWLWNDFKTRRISSPLSAPRYRG